MAFLVLTAEEIPATPEEIADVLVDASNDPSGRGRILLGTCRSTVSMYRRPLFITYACGLPSLRSVVKECFRASLPPSENRVYLRGVGNRYRVRIRRPATFATLGCEVQRYTEDGPRDEEYHEVVDIYITRERFLELEADYQAKLALVRERMTRLVRRRFDRML